MKVPHWNGQELVIWAGVGDWVGVKRQAGFKQAQYSIPTLVLSFHSGKIYIYSVRVGVSISSMNHYG